MDRQENVPPPVDAAAVTQEELDAAQPKALRALQRDAELHATCVAMVISRQLHNVALLAFERIADRLRLSTAERAFLQAAMRGQALQPFQRHELLDQLVKSAAPWLANEVALEREAEAAEEAAAEVERIEREQNTPLPLPWTLEGLEDGLRPGKLLVLHADTQTALDVRLSELTASAGEWRTVRLVERVLNDNIVRERNALTYVELGHNRWLRNGTSAKSLDDLLSQVLGSLVNGRLDLLVVDILGDLRDQSLIADPVRDALSVQRALSRWSEERAVRVVAGVVGEPDADNSAWRGLAEHTWLRRCPEEPAVAAEPAVEEAAG